MRLDPRLVHPREVYADVLLESGTDHDTAHGLLDEVLASGEYTYRTPYLRSQGAPPEAREELLRHAIGMDPDYVPALAELSDLLIDEGARLEEAFALVERAMLIEPTVAAHVQRLGRAFLYSGDPERALAAADLVRTWRPARGTTELANALEGEIAAYAENQGRQPDRATIPL